jgi:hypothetical protein
MPQSERETAAMRLLFLLLALAGFGSAAAGEIPLPRPRPPVDAAAVSLPVAGSPDLIATDATAEPTACDERLKAMAIFRPLPRLVGPGACGGSDMVALDAVRLADNGRIALTPPPVLRCAMAESLSVWLREDAAPRVAKLGSALRGIENYDSYECRSRNRVAGAKLSEHAKGNAVDLRDFILADGRVIQLTDVTLAVALRSDLRDSACRRFTTVLGPGSDGFHNGHIHLDIAERSHGYRICQWDIDVPPPAGVIAGNVPLPVPRPAIAAEPVKHSGKL